MQEHCSICGSLQEFTFLGGDARDDGICQECDAPLKEREAGQFVLEHAAGGRFSSIKELSDTKTGDIPGIVEFAYSSAMSRQMAGHPAYHQRYFWLSGKDERNGAGKQIPFGDLRDTRFETSSMDVIVTNDALNFVEDLHLTLHEMARVIRRGGAFISINKIDWPVPSATLELKLGERRKYRVPDGFMPIRRRLGADVQASYLKHGFRLMLRQIGFSASGKRNFSLVGIRV